MSWSTQQKCDNAAIENIVIIGDDLLGWCAAVGLARGLQGQHVNISVVKSTQLVSPDPVTHASAHLFDFHRLLGIQDKQLLAKGHAKLCSGSRFLNFSSQYNDYMVGCEKSQPSFFTVELHHVLRWLSVDEPERYSLSSQASQKSLLALPTKDNDVITSGFSPMVNLDTVTYQRFMQGAALHMGVTYQQSPVQQLDYCGDSGFVQQITLTDGTKLAVDLMIDNSDPTHLDNQISPQRHFEDCQSLLSFDRKITALSNIQGQPQPYQQFTATEHGVCEINFMPNGHSATLHYQSNNSDDTQAKEQLSTILKGATHFNIQATRAGYSTNTLYKNSFAIGDSAAYLGTSPFSQLVLTQRSISKLLELFPGKGCLPANSIELNRRITKDYQHALHYSLLSHQFTEGTARFSWQRTLDSLPADLQQRIRLYSGSGRLSNELNPLITRDAWIRLLKFKVRHYQNYEPVLDALDKHKGQQYLQQVQHRIQHCLAHYSPYR